MMPTTLDDIRRLAVGRSLFAPTTLDRAIDTLGFVQADPDPRAGAGAGPDSAAARRGLSRRRPRAALPRARDRRRRLHQLRLRHPRGAGADAPAGRRVAAADGRQQARAGPAGLRARARHGAPARSRRAFLARHASPTTGAARRAPPRTCSRRCTTRDCCASPAATTASAFTRSTGTGPHRWDRRRAKARVDALVDVLVQQYAPLPAASLSQVIEPPALRGAAVAWRIAKRAAASQATAGARGDRRPVVVLAGTRVSDAARRQRRRVHLLAPFDPVVWDRRRFELLWGWPYRFEAYTPVAETQARLLRAADVVARPRRRVGRFVDQERRAARRVRLLPPANRRASAASSANSTRKSSGCACSSRCALADGAALLDGTATS